MKVQLINNTGGVRNHVELESKLTWRTTQIKPLVIVSQAHGRIYKIKQDPQTHLYELYRGSEYNTIWTHIESFNHKPAAVIAANLIANG